MNILRFIPRVSGLPAMATLPDSRPVQAAGEVYIEHFHAPLCGVNLQGVEGFGELAHAPGAAAKNRLEADDRSRVRSRCNDTQ
jgi:hypothetical protein